MRKLRFGLDGRNLPIPWKVQKVVSSIKVLIGLASVQQYIADSPVVSFWLLIGGAFIDELSKYFYEE